MCPAQCRAQGKTISITVDCTALLPAEFNHFLYSNGTINLQTVPVEVEVRLYLSRCSLKRKKKKSLSVILLFKPSQKALVSKYYLGCELP